MRIAIKLPMAPHAKGRGRIIRRGGFSGIKTPEKTKAWEGAAAMLIRRSLPFDTPIQGPVALCLDFVHPRNKGRPKSVENAMWATGARVASPTRPDVDNLAKATMDALTKAGAWKDDGQVWSLIARKWYAASDEKPHVMVVLEW